MAGFVEVRMLADCVGLRFGGDPLKAADAAGIYVRWRNLPRGIAVAYFHPTEDQRAGSILVERRTHQQRPRLVVLGLAHHLLRHRERRPYTWSLEGSLDVDWRAELEAQQFAAAFLATTPVKATIRA